MSTLSSLWVSPVRTKVIHPLSLYRSLSSSSFLLLHFPRSSGDSSSLLGKTMCVCMSLWENTISAPTQSLEKEPERGPILATHPPCWRHPINHSVRQTYDIFFLAIKWSYRVMQIYPSPHTQLFDVITTCHQLFGIIFSSCIPMFEQPYDSQWPYILFT
jgi:hypothetical protein